MDSDTASIFAKSVRLNQFVDKDNSFKNGIVASPPPNAKAPTLKNWKNTSKTIVVFKAILKIIPNTKIVFDQVEGKNKKDAEAHDKKKSKNVNKKEAKVEKKSDVEAKETKVEKEADADEEGKEARNDKTSDEKKSRHRKSESSEG